MEAGGVKVMHRKAPALIHLHLRHHNEPTVPAHSAHEYWARVTSASPDCPAVVVSVIDSRSPDPNARHVSRKSAPGSCQRVALLSIIDALGVFMHSSLGTNGVEAR